MPHCYGPCAPLSSGFVAPGTLRVRCGKHKPQTPLLLAVTGRKGGMQREISQVSRKLIEVSLEIFAKNELVLMPIWNYLLL